VLKKPILGIYLRLIKTESVLNEKYLTEIKFGLRLNDAILTLRLVFYKTVLCNFTQSFIYKRYFI
jgi:hypothetical protein